jgi:hypothetical protein
MPKTKHERKKNAADMAVACTTTFEELILAARLTFGRALQWPTKRR